MKRDFKNKNVLITGAAGNLGTELCLIFAKSGANIFAIDLDKEAIDALYSILINKDYSAKCFTCDITNKSELENIISNIRQKIKIDILINNAGITHIKRFEEIEDPELVLRKVMEVNLFAAVNLTKFCFVDLLEQKGMIINISSVAGFAPLLGRTAYAASKHAILGYFESLRTELFEKEVHCMNVCPSFIGIETGKTDYDLKNINSVNQKKKLIGRALNPQFVARKIFKAALKNKSTLIIGNTAKKAYLIHRLFPNLYESLMSKKLKREL